MFPFHFLPVASQAFLDGSAAHLPWLQELPDVVSTAMWSSWIEINPTTAGRMGIAQGDMVEVTSPRGSLKTAAVISPGIAPDVVAMPVGQGHENFTRYASGRGANPIAILGTAVEPETGSLAWAATRVQIRKVAEPAQLVLFAGGMREREVEHR
jgi:anaerobic selenocysteine-containing dehydrogenase